MTIVTRYDLEYQEDGKDWLECFCSRKAQLARAYELEERHISFTMSRNTGPLFRKKVKVILHQRAKSRTE